MSRDVLEHLIWSLEQSFRKKPEHSLIANLSSVTTEDLDTVVPGGGRTMRDLIIHCGAVKLMHANHAFGDATLHLLDHLAPRRSDQRRLIRGFAGVVGTGPPERDRLGRQARGRPRTRRPSSHLLGRAMGDAQRPRRHRRPRRLPRRRDQPPQSAAAPGRIVRPARQNRSNSPKRSASPVGPTTANRSSSSRRVLIGQPRDVLSRHGLVALVHFVNRFDFVVQQRLAAIPGRDCS